MMFIHYFIKSSSVGNQKPYLFSKRNYLTHINFLQVRIPPPTINAPVVSTVILDTPAPTAAVD